MTSTRILTWNVQLFSWAAMVALQGNPAPVNKARERAGEIARRLVADSDDWDVVGLTEVWHEGAHDIFDGNTVARYPHRVAKADDTTVRIGMYGGASGVYWTPLLNAAVTGSARVTDAWTFEDSGLMLLSQHPFELLSTAAFGEYKEQAIFSGAGFPDLVPAVAFFPYEDSDDDDSKSRKGLLYARILRDGKRIHVFVTHTQADYTHQYQYESVRAKQFAFAETCIRACVGEPPFGEEVFLMGDLNVPGEQLHSAGDAEWRRLFAAPGRLFTDALVDSWGAAQCTGRIAPADRDNPCAGPIGLYDSGQTATCSAPPPAVQRLDYHLISRTSALAAQHVRTRWDLSRPPIGYQYLSDHLPYSIDLARPLPNSTPVTAECVRDADIAGKYWIRGQRWISQGQVQWFRFDRSGSYDFRVITDAGHPVRFEVYADTDLSRPFSRHLLTPPNDWGERYIISTSPVLLKVFSENRHGESFFEVRGRRHVGESAFTAIDVPWCAYTSEAHPIGDRLNAEDAKWFRITGTVRPLPRPVQGVLTVRRTFGSAPFGVRLHRWVNGGTTPVAATGADASGVARLTVELLARDDLRFAIMREDAGLSELGYVIDLQTDVTFALGGGMENVRLTCVTETSGWSNDDIEVDWAADGVSLAYIKETTIKGFWEGMTQDIGQYLPDVTPYWEGLGLRLIEQDDLSPNDIGRATINPLQTISSAVDITVTDVAGLPSARDVQQFIDVDDGRYRLEARVVGWDPRI